MENDKIIIIFISIIAILISIITSAITYVQNFKNQKRQLRIGKIEEMLEITHILNGNYSYFTDTQYLKTKILSNSKKPNEKEKYLVQVEKLREVSEEIGIRNKLSRLYILNNSYLPENEFRL